MKKKLILVATLILAIASFVCIFSISASAETATTPSVSIDKYNLVFEDNVYLKYAVKFDGVDDNDITSSNIGMLYFTTPQESYIEGNEASSSAVVGYTTIDGEKYYTFEYRHITAKQMTDYIYSIAYIDLDGERYYSEPVKYSVLDYCYSKLGKTGEASTNEDFKNLLTATLEQGAMAQKYFGYNINRLANDEYYLVEVVGGTLEDGFTKGLYHAGETATLTAPETSDGTSFSKWQNSTGESVSSDNPAVLTGFSKNDTYTAIYEGTVKYSEGLEYTSNSDGTCYVSGIGTCKDTDIVIPEISPEGDSVTAIGDNAFYMLQGFESVTIPDSVTKIGDGALSQCKSLKSVIIPNSVTYIGSYAFYYSDSLSSVFIPASVTYIGDSAFSYCWINNITVSAQNEYYKDVDGNLYTKDGKILVQYSIGKGETTFVIPEGVVRISSEAFGYNSYIISVIIPESVTEIGNNAFAECYQLSDLVIPSSVRKIGHGAFTYCKFSSCVIPDGVTEIGGYTFMGCSSLTSIVIPESVTTINEAAFYWCNALTDVHYKSSEDNWNKIFIDSYCNEKLQKANIHFNYGKLEYSEGLEYTSNGDGTCYVSGIGTCEDTEIIIPAVSPDGLSVTSIGEFAFYDNTLLTSIIIPDSVTSIDRFALYYCTALTSVTLPKSVTNIETHAFAGCTSLAKIVIPDSVLSIGDSAFYDSTSLTIYCEATSKPSGWDNYWNFSDRPVVWGYTEE